MTSIPFLFKRSRGREMLLAVRNPVMSHNSEGAKRCCSSRSTSTMRCCSGSFLRSSPAATSPPTPPPSTRTRLLPFMWFLPSEHKNPIRRQCPGGQLLHAASPAGVGELAVCDSARIHTGPAHADLRPSLCYGTEHDFQAVVAARDFLILLRAGYRVSDQKYSNFAAFLAGERASEPEPVVASLGAVRGVVENEEVTRQRRLHLQSVIHRASRMPSDL